MPKKKKGGNWQCDYPKKKGATLLPKQKRATLLPRGREKKIEENMGIFVNQEKIHHSSVFSPF